MSERRQYGDVTKDRKIHGESNVWSTGEMSKKLMLMLYSKDTTDQLDMANSVLWHGHALWREDDQVLRGTLDFEVESQKKKRMSKKA